VLEIQNKSSNFGEIDQEKKRIIYGIRTSTKIFDTMSIQNRQRHVGLNMEEQEKNHKKLNKTLKDRFIISENNRWKAAFDVTVLLLVGYSCFTTVYYVAFS